MTCRVLAGISSSESLEDSTLIPPKRLARYPRGQRGFRNVNRAAASELLTAPLEATLG